MFIIFGSVSTKTEKIIPRDYFSGTEKARNNLFQKTFFFLLNMMHQSSLVEMSNYKDTSTQTIQVRLCEVMHFMVTLTHSLSHFRDIVASPPEGHSSHKKGKISAQPHTIVKLSSKPKGNLLFPSFSLPTKCMHDEISGC